MLMAKAVVGTLKKDIQVEVENRDATKCTSSQGSIQTNALQRPSLQRIDSREWLPGLYDLRTVRFEFLRSLRAHALLPHRQQRA